MGREVMAAAAWETVMDNPLLDLSLPVAANAAANAAINLQLLQLNTVFASSD